MLLKDLKHFFKTWYVETVISNNGPQYASHEFAKFASSYNFKHVTSSLLFLQSNRQAERTVQTAKKLLKNAKDPYMALLTYHTTPLSYMVQPITCTASHGQMFENYSAASGCIYDHCHPQWKYLESFINKARSLSKSRSQYLTGDMVYIHFHL